MGIFRFIGTLLKHPIMDGALSEIVPATECVMIDYNACIHYILQKTITDLNQIIYFTYRQKELNSELQRYIQIYDIGTTYDEMKLILSNYDNITHIIFSETIEYTKN